MLVLGTDSFISLIFASEVSGENPERKGVVCRRLSKQFIPDQDTHDLTMIKVFIREEREDLRFGERVSQSHTAGLCAMPLEACFTDPGSPNLSLRVGDIVVV